MPNNLLYLALALIAGVGIPMMASMNGALSTRLGSNSIATAALFFGAFVISLIPLLFTGLSNSATNSSLFSKAPFYLYLSGGFVVFYMLCVTWLIPRIGLGNAIFFVLVGQIISASIIDHFGLFNAPVTPLSGMRVIGVLVMIIGLFLSRRIS